MKQTFDAGTAQRIQITDVAEELQVRGWDQPTIEVSSSGQINQLQPQDNTLVINGCDENLTIMVPYASLISASDLHDSVSIEHVQQVDIHDVGDDLKLKDIEQATVGSVGGDFDAQDINTLKCDSVGHDCQVSGLRESVIVIRNIGKDLTVRAVAQLTVDNIGRGCRVTNSEQAEIAIRNIGDDLDIIGARQVTIEKIGSDASIRGTQGNVSIQVIGSDLALTDIGGEIRFNTVGSDAILKNIHGQVNAGNIGADLHLQAGFAPESVSHLNVGGDATIILPTDPNLTIQAFVGGDITGRAIVSSQTGNRATLTYGEGAAHLKLMVGGDLSLRSDKGPKSSSNSNAWWNDFGREMADFGRGMSNLGRDLGAEIASSVAESMNINAVSASTQQKYKDKADQMRQKTEAKIRRAQDKNIRLNIRLHDREWRMDPDRINRIVEEAQQATADGVHGAMEAVEQALRNINLTRPMPPTQPTPPTFPPTADPTDIYAQPVDERAQLEVPAVPANTQSAAINIEQEREAILRMIAEGRITPEEGDMLLEALGN